MSTIFQLEFSLVDGKHATHYILHVMSKGKTPAEYRRSLEKFVEYSQRKDELDKLHADIDRLDRIYDNYAVESTQFDSLYEQVEMLEELALYKDIYTPDDIWNLHHSCSCLEERRDTLEIKVGLCDNPLENKQYEYILEKYGDLYFDSEQQRASFLIGELCERGYETLESLQRVDSYRRIHGMTTYVSVLEEIARVCDYKKSTGREFYKLNIPNYIYIPFLTH
jgi:hypothetical protein